MRIQSWHVDGFGALHDVDMSDPGEGVTIFVGENEAGKSTLLAFLRAMLFGCPDGRRRERQYPPVAGGRHGGSIVLIGDSGLWRLRRYAEPRKTLEVLRPDGHAGDEADLRSLLLGVDATLFASVFAFSLDELQQFATLNAEGVRERIFSVGISGAGHSARAVLKDLASTQADLLKQRAGKAVLNDLARVALSLQEELREARRRALEYPDLVAAEGHAEAQLASRDEQLEEIAADRRYYEALTSLLPEWRGLQEAEHALAQLPVPTDPALVDEVASLTAQLHILKSREATLPDLAAERDAANGDLERHLHALGHGWDRARLEALDDSLATRDQVRAWAQRLDEGRQAVAAAQATVAAARTHLAELADDRAYCAQRLPENAPPSLNTTTGKEVVLRGLRSRLRELELAELQSTAQESRSSVWLALAVAAILSLVGALVAMFADTIQLAGGFAIAALALAGSAFALRRATHHADPDTAAGRDALERLRSDVTTTGAALGLSPRPTAAELDSLETTLSRERDQRLACDGTQAQVEEIERKLVQGRTRLERLVAAQAAAQSDMDRCEAQWTSWTHSRELPAVTPEGALELLDSAHRARSAAQLQERADHAIAIVRDERRQWDLVAGSALGSAAAADGVVGADLERRLAALATDLERRARVAHQRDEHERRVQVALAALHDQAAKARTDLESGDPASWAARLDSLSIAERLASNARTTAIEARRDAQTARARLEESADVPRLEAELEVTRTEIAAAAHEYRVAAAAEALVRDTLRSYARDRQPGVLERASRAFSTVTAGRYRAVVQVVDAESDEILVEQYDGARLRPDQLSRGTAEQLYLTIRLALAAEFAIRGQELPLIMDDCLVNFDPRRAAAMAAHIAAATAGAQCLFFTCHPATADMLHRACDGHARIIPLPTRQLP